MFVISFAKIDIFFDITKYLYKKMSLSFMTPLMKIAIFFTKKVAKIFG